jgi:hypothetical protein
VSVSSATSRIVYTGNNSLVTAYAVPFYFEENAHLNAIAKTAAGVETVVTLTNHNGAGDPNGGTVRTAVAVPATSTLTIYREVPATQTTSYAENDSFPAASHERALDKLTTITQQLERRITNCIRGTEATPLSPIPSPTGTQQFVLSAASNQPPSWQELPVLATGPITATGSTQARFLSDRFADAVNVKDFGAAGDGVTDDTAAIQAAVNTGKRVTFPAGNFAITSSILNTTGAMLIGAGIEITKITVIGSGYDAVALSSDYSGVESMSFQSPTYRTSGSTVAVTAAVRGNAVKSCRFNSQFNPIAIKANAVITWISDCEAINTTPSTGVVIDIAGGNDTMIARVVADNPALSQPLAGLRLFQSQAIWCTDSDFIQCGSGMVVSPDSGQVISWLFVNNTAFDLGAGPGVVISPTGTGSVRGVFFNGCWTSSNDRGVLVQKSPASVLDGIIFDQHKALNNRQQGALIIAGNNVRFSDPLISGNSQSSFGAAAGVDIQAGVSNFSIQGGKIGAAIVFPQSQAYGVLVNSGSSDGYSIIGVDVAGNTLAGIYDGGSGNSKTISGNHGYSTRSSGVGTITTGNTSVVIAHGLAEAPLVDNLSISPTVNTGTNNLFIDSSSITSSSFTVRTLTAVPNNYLFTWQASIKNN